MSFLVYSLVAISITCIYSYVKYLYSYWERCGVKQFRPSFPFGDLSNVFLQKQSVARLYQEIYNSAPTEPYIGIYSLFQPILIARDSEFLQNILIKDFQHFTDHGVYHDEKVDPLSAHLFSLTGEKWKNIRAKLSPAFTPGKLKAMFSTLIDCSVPLKQFLDTAAKSKESFESRELCACYTTNIIASVGFGIDVDCIANPNTPFRRYGRQVFELNFKNGFRMIMHAVFPSLMRVFKMRVFDYEVEEFMMSMVKQALDARERQNVVRKDFFQLFVQLRNTGNVQTDDHWQTVISSDVNKKLTIEEIAAHAFVFYAAGFETTSSTMSFCMYEIAKNQEIQRQVQNEIDSVLEKYNGQLTYEAANEVKYLEACIDETLRLYPPTPLLPRECTKDYLIPGTNTLIKKGMFVQIPTFAIQRDSKYYPRPDEFDPTRYLDGNIKSFVESPYLPFGEGPRACIGIRLGKMGMKIGLISMLKEFNLHLSEEYSGKSLEFSPASVFLIPTSGNNLKITRR